jgi:hypothetical protein
MAMDKSFLVLFFKKEQDFFLEKEAKTFYLIRKVILLGRRAGDIL